MKHTPRTSPLAWLGGHGWVALTGLMSLMSLIVCLCVTGVQADPLSTKAQAPAASTAPGPHGQVVRASADAGVPGSNDLGFSDTPMQPNGKWHVHDGTRPQPKIVTPGTFPHDAQAGTPPSDALVLFNGTDLSHWETATHKPASWAVKNGVLEAGPGGPIQTKEIFQDFQLHVEWASPETVKGDGQGRGNSGVFLLGAFELQVLDSWHNPTYPDGQAGAMYSQYPPLVNVAKPPGVWQAYDIVFTAPRFAAGSPKVERPAIVTAFLNGVVVHNATAFWGPTGYRKVLPYKPENAQGPLVLQDHGNPVRYRNIWIRPLTGYDQ